MSIDYLTNNRDYDYFRCRLLLPVGARRLTAIKEVQRSHRRDGADRSNDNAADVVNVSVYSCCTVNSSQQRRMCAVPVTANELTDTD